MEPSTVNSRSITISSKLGSVSILIDEADLPLISGRKLHIATFPHTKDIHACCGQKRVARVLMGAGPGEEVDHRNGDTLDNRRENLRLCTHGENTCNRRGWSKSGYKGVAFVKKTGKYWAYICRHGRTHSLRYHDTAEDAARAYNAAAKRLHGEFAKLNVLAA